MSLLHLTFDPTLSLWKNGDIDDWYSSGSTGDAAADAIIEHKLITDAIDFSHAYTSPQWEVYAYQFDPQARTIHLWVKNPTGGAFSNSTRADSPTCRACPPSHR